MNYGSDGGTKPLLHRLGMIVLTGAGVGLCFWIVIISTWAPQLWMKWWWLGILAGVVTVAYIIVRWTNWVRGLVQCGVFLAAEMIYLCSGTLCGQCPLSFGVCPAGTIQRLAFMPEFPWYWTLGAVLATGAILGTVVCGWLCPIGFVQDLVNSLKLRRVMLPKRINLVRWIMATGAIILVPVELRWRLLSRWGLLVFSDYTIITFVLVLILSLVVARPFCRTVCPFGLLYGLLNRVSPIKVRLQTSRCRDCGKCESVCVSGIRPRTDVNGVLCSKCSDCRTASLEQECARPSANPSAQLAAPKGAESGRCAYLKKELG